MAKRLRVPAMTLHGALHRTIYVLRYMRDGALRDRVHLQLNRGEHRHALTDRMFLREDSIVLRSRRLGRRGA